MFVVEAVQYDAPAGELVPRGQGVQVLELDPVDEE